jgi:hypothetical protein
MISNIHTLINILELNYNGNNIQNYKEIIKKYNGDDWKNYIDSSKCLTQPFIKIKLYESSNIEIILICWEENYSTQYHKHPKYGCVLHLCTFKTPTF